MDTHKKVYLLLGAIIVILVAIMAYAFVIQPFIDRNLAAAQGEGVALTINAIVQQIQTQGYAAIPVGEQTLILAPVEVQDPAPSTATDTQTQESLETEATS
ncbi:MAG: hypothetical protein WDZ77_02070 [Candidatus Pacearchaeota archaeon]